MDMTHIKVGVIGPTNVARVSQATGIHAQVYEHTAWWVGAQLARLGTALVVVPDRGVARHAMTGYRSGFIGAEPGLIDALRSFRPNTGTAPQEFVQRASAVAWSDEAHVEEMRARYGRKRDLLALLLEVAPGSSEATFYLWCRVSGGLSSEAFAERLLEHGVVVAPGSYFGPSGEGYVRLALVPSLKECERAAAILAEVL